MSQYLQDAENRIAKALESLQVDFFKIRSGRVSASVLDNVRVDNYGAPAPISQVATISNPEARLIVISPWDKSMISSIEKAIQKENIGVNPSNDGKVIRLAFPALSKERRNDSVKEAKQIAENHKISVRNIRRDVLDSLKKDEKDGLISENERKSIEDKVQKAVDKGIERITEAFDKKSAEIMEI
ncbi:MAG TPA: ribosome recycling factor [Spirochaetaceae bacterium]|nr:ribosome recycling factor [Spirochaetaceae bacterium]